MKIYTNHKDGYVGLVLLSDKNEEYFRTGFKPRTEDKISGHILGIDRALSWVRYNEPLYAQGNVDVYMRNTNSQGGEGTTEADLINFEVSVLSNEYINNWSQRTNQEVRAYPKEYSEKDKYWLMVAGNEAKFEKQRQETIKLANSNKNQNS